MISGVSCRQFCQDSVTCGAKVLATDDAQNMVAKAGDIARTIPNHNADKSCPNKSAKLGLYCDRMKHHEVQGEWMMKTLVDTLAVDGAKPCKSYDARFNEVKNPRYHGHNEMCYVNRVGDGKHEHNRVSSCDVKSYSMGNTISYNFCFCTTTRPTS